MQAEKPFYPEWDIIVPYFNKTKGRNYVTLRRSITNPHYVTGELNQTGMTLARYKMSVALGRRLNNNEHVDHIDNNKTNDDISNLQILDPIQNQQKYYQHFRDDVQQVVELTCANCHKKFSRIEWRHNVSLKKNAENTFCSLSCRSQYNVRHEKTGLRAPVPYDTVQLVLAELKKGHKYSTIGEVYGISKSMVAKIARENNATPSKRDFEYLKSQILELHARGMSYRDIVANLGVSLSTVSSTLKGNNLTIKNNENKVDNEYYIKSVKEMRDSGSTIENIAEKLSISNFTVNKILNKLGMSKTIVNKLNDTEIDYIRKMRESGMGRNEIARITGYSNSTIQNHLTAMGLAREYAKHDRLEIYLKTMELLDNGVSMYAIAKQLKYDYHSLVRLKDKYNGYRYDGDLDALKNMISNIDLNKDATIIFKSQDDYPNLKELFPPHTIKKEGFLGATSYYVVMDFNGD